jgi:hypothetical protein
MTATGSTGAITAAGALVRHEAKPVGEASG